MSSNFGRRFPILVGLVEVCCKTLRQSVQSAQISMKNGKVEGKVEDLCDFICEDLLVDDELAAQIDTSMGTFTSGTLVKVFLFASYIWLWFYPGT